MPTVLLITPYFPPMSVVGAKRPLNLVRHLPHFGWQPVVLAGDPAGENVDLGLSDLIPADLPVSYAYGEGKQVPTESAPRPREKERRFLGWDAGYITPFDRYLWHNGAALREAAHLIEKHRPSAVVVCADPWSPLLVGMKLAHSPGLPLVVDFRDPWSLQRAKMALRPPPTRWIIRQTEYRVFRTARRIVLNTEECHDAYTAAYRGRVPSERFTCIRNAFDLGVFNETAVQRNDRFTVLHFGHFRRLVPSEPLLKGFAKFVQREGLGADKAALVLAGTPREEDLRHASSLGIADYVESRPHIPYREALGVMRSADVLALVTVGDMALTVPAKLYDYLAARRPILAITDQPEPGRIVDQTGAGVVVPPANPEAIAAGLARLRVRCQAPDRGEIPAESVTAFDAEEQARRFAAVLEAAIAR